MSAALERLKQQNAQDERRQQLDTPETMEVLTSILAAVEGQNRRIEAVAERQEKLTLFMKTMDDDLPERVASETSISQASASSSQQIASVESRLSEIESTLGEFATSLDGRRLQSASQSLIAETQKNHAATVSAAEKLQAQAEENQKLVSCVGGAVQRIEKRADERAEKAIEKVVGEASAVMTASFDATNEQAERVLAATAKLEARQLWSAAAAMCLVLLPVAVTIAGVWMAVVGLITGTQWALDVEGRVWLGIGRWLLVAAGLATAGYGLFASVRWVAGLVESWRGYGMPKWPRWKR